MASKQERKLHKRKTREKESREKVLKQREVLRAPAREERADARRIKRIKKLQRDLEQFDQYMDQRELDIVSEETLTQLEKNIQILKVLEEEHARETQRKEFLNKQLENQGYHTLEEKMQAAREVLTAEVGVGGSAECRVFVNKPTMETAEVSVTKAPVVLTENS